VSESVDVFMYDSENAWSPNLLKMGRAGGTGGFEKYQAQIATWLAAQGYSVEVRTPDVRHDFAEAGVQFNLSDRATHCGALISARHSPIPDWIHADRIVSSAVDDPRGQAEKFAHLRGRSTIVCISDWQRDLYREQGHDALTIHSVLDDEYYDYDRRPLRQDKSGFVCVNAWNKGTDATLAWWSRFRQRFPRWTTPLSVGSPYSEPPDAEERCALAGARWLGRLKPAQIVDALDRAEAVLRVCVAPETFGVADAIAEARGTRVHCLCTNGFGAAREALVSPYLTDDASAFESCVMLPLQDYPPPKDWRVSTVMPKWLDVLGLRGVS